MKIAIALGILAAIAAAAPTPHGAHPRSEEGTTVDDISQQLYGAWGGIKKRAEEAAEGTTVDDISQQLYGAWG
ncbi:hypothetical protein BDW74DRAFT_183114, partial [Aspergillus multicolor]|uniref:uncharacterized protein n=1 Tax=Aspergillus multicolor TaxID=41759 RepID=UPI003CCD909E